MLYSEQEIVSLLKERNLNILRYLHNKYAPILYRFICKMMPDAYCTEDILQQIFLKIWTNIATLDIKKQSLYTWIVDIVREEVKASTIKSRVRLNADALDSLKNNSLGIYRVMTGLKKEDQVIMQLSYFKGCSINEISDITHIPKEIVRKRLKLTEKTLQGQEYEMA